MSKIALKVKDLPKEHFFGQKGPNFKGPYLGNEKGFFKKIFTGLYFHVFEQNIQKLAKSEDITSSTYLNLTENASK